MENTNRKHYSEAFKKEAVIRVMGESSSANGVSKDPGVSQSVLSGWVREFKRKGASVFGQEGVEIKKLQRENKRLKAEKAVSFFAKHDR